MRQLYLRRDGWPYSADVGTLLILHTEAHCICLYFSKILNFTRVKSNVESLLTADTRG
jgi:hypothetical protein